jgi:hypothetical protein
MRWILELSLLGSLLVGAAWSQTARTSRGTIVAVRPEAGQLIVALSASGGEPIESIFYVDELTRIRESSGVVSLPAVPSGRAVAVTYDRLDGRNVARLVEISPASPGPPPPDSFDSLEERERYEESQAAKLDIFEEEIEELRRASETRGAIELARSNVWSDRLEGLLSEARERQRRLVSIRSPAAWERGRRELEESMNALGEELFRARASITGR